MTDRAPSPTVRSQAEAIKLLDDAAYFRWCRMEADKFFAALVSKRFPQLVAERPAQMARARAGV